MYIYIYILTFFVNPLGAQREKNICKQRLKIYIHIPIGKKSY